MTIAQKAYRFSLLLLLIALLCDARAQTVTNATNIHIEDGLEVHIDGNVDNTGFIQNQGNLFVTGNWRNTNVYQGLGTITLNGLQSQDFWNNKNAVYHFVIDGDGRKNIINTLPITNRFDLLSELFM